MPDRPSNSKKPRSSTITKGGKVRTVIFLDPELKRALKVAAAERDCAASEIVSAALRRYLGDA